MGWIMIEIVFVFVLMNYFNTLSVVRATENVSTSLSNQLYSNMPDSQTESLPAHEDVTFYQSGRKMSISTPGTFNYSLSYIAEQCPEVDICFQKGIKMATKPKRWCCVPCSCQQNCTIIGNCCNKGSTDDSMCHTTTVEFDQSDDEKQTEFFMIDKCLNTPNFTDCKGVDTYPWGPLYPVYDPSSDIIFFNEQCAECNGINRYTHWDLTINCGTNELNSGMVVGGLNGKRCKLVFYPPRKTKLETIKKHICSNNLISSCNATGLWSTYDAKLEEACSQYYAPVATARGYLTYANIYCQLCNLPDTSDIAEKLCKSITGNVYSRTLGEFDSLTTLISFKMISNILDRYKGADIRNIAEGKCGKHMVNHPTKAECRTILCPSGFIRTDDNCEAISTIWFKNYYYIQLELTSLTNSSLPLSYLNELSENEKNQPDLWLDSKGAPLDYFEVFVEKVEFKNVIFVRKMILRVGKEKYPLNIVKETESIRKAVGKIWEMKLKGETFSFSVKIDKFTSYIFGASHLPRHDVVVYAYNGTAVYETNQTRNIFEKLPLLSVYPKGFGTSIELRRVNFCEKVRLLASEWSSGYQEIRLHPSITRSDSGKTLGDSEFELYFDDSDMVTVEICVEDFNSGYKKHISNGSLFIVYNGPVLILYTLFKNIS